MCLVGSLCIIVVAILVGCRSQATIHPPAPPKAPRHVSVSLTIWAGQPGHPDHYSSTVPQVVVPDQAPFWIVMQIAKLKDKNLRYEDYPYTMAINGFRERPWDNYNWVLYVLPETPDPENPPGQQYLAQDGRENTLANDGDNFLFWLHDFMWQPWVEYD